MSFDQWVLDSAVSQRTAWLVDVVDVITDSGGTLASWLIATLLTIVLLVRGLRTEALLIAGSMLTGLLVMSGLKRIFTRTRPPLPERLIEIDSYSFPSGHAMMSAILATSVAAVILRLALPRLAKMAMLASLGLYTIAVGFSRCTGRLGVRDDVGRGVDLGNRADQKAPGAGYFVSSASSWLVAHGKLSAELAVKAAPTCGA